MILRKTAALRARWGLGFLGAAAGLAQSGCDPADITARPPEQYRHAPSAIVIFAETDAIDALCRSMGVSADKSIRACFVNGVIYMPQPCGWSDPYAQTFCHETGHAVGWVHG
ncbi:MAG: hypothetical protein JWP92_3750 [Caulobacter sp.]|nr:hypothetical protein [Caulobacter sp.]